MAVKLFAAAPLKGCKCPICMVAQARKFHRSGVIHRACEKGRNSESNQEKRPKDLTEDEGIHDAFDANAWD